MEETPKYKLKKPSPDDYVDIEVLNQNMDIIDRELISIFIQSAEPAQNNCIWIQAQKTTLVAEDGEIVLNFSDSPESEKYFVEIDGQDKPVENVVDSDSDLAVGNYRIEIL